MELRTPTDAEQTHVRALLVDAGLPVADLATAAVDFIIAVDAGVTAGVVGLETYGGAGLLRSLAVRQHAQGAGLGARLVDAIESRARMRGIQQLVLLTQTAEPFFAKRGYRVVERRTIPAPVLQSTEFRSLCPVSATCMSKFLDRTP